MARKSTGLIVAPFTGMRKDGELNLDIVELQAEFLTRKRVAGVFVGGTTGEWASLTLPERWMQVAGGYLRVLVHAGARRLRACPRSERTP